APTSAVAARTVGRRAPETAGCSRPGAGGGGANGRARPTAEGPGATTTRRPRAWGSCACAFRWGGPRHITDARAPALQANLGAPRLHGGGEAARGLDLGAQADALARLHVDHFRHVPQIRGHVGRGEHVDDD